MTDPEQTNQRSEMGPLISQSSELLRSKNGEQVMTFHQSQQQHMTLNQSRGAKLISIYPQWNVTFNQSGKQISDMYHTTKQI